jgi:RHS repeat-associated protein
MRYEYNGNGNLVAEVYGGTAGGMGTAGRQVREDGGVWSADYGFGYVDVTGTAGSGAGGGTAGERREYRWNERNLLRSSANRRFSAEYRYGADGERAVKFSVSGTARSETLYFNRMLTMSRVQGYETESKHIYVGEARIATKQRDVGNTFTGQETRQVYYYHPDHLGSTQLVTDWDGKIYEHLEYTPYGELWVDHAVAAVATNPTAYRFSGKEMDEETGFYYYGARYLDPRTSRWISADPAMEDYIPGPGQGPDKLSGMGGVFNHVNLHVYHYAGNNPIKYVDPTGRDINSVRGEGVTDEEWHNFKAEEARLAASDTEAGRRYRELYKSADVTVTIYVNTSGDSNTDPVNRDDATNGVGSGSIVNINIRDTGNYVWESVEKDLGATLAHEVSGHAYDNYRGSNPYHGTRGNPKTTWGDRFRAEQNAVAMENEYRDYKGLDQRKMYVINGWPLDMPILNNEPQGRYFEIRNSVIDGNFYRQYNGNRRWREN